VQYAWASGYDPAGFIRFFDKVATTKGYINGVSWFRTHPLFYQRMVSAEREILFMPPKPAYVTQTSNFEEMKKKLAPITTAAEKEEIGKPSLRITREKGCEPLKKLEYTVAQPIEELCAALPQTSSPSNPAK
jgi:predicted Zn-dependent protease